MTASQLDLFWVKGEKPCEVKIVGAEKSDPVLASASSDVRGGVVVAMNETFERTVVPEGNKEAQMKFDQAVNLYETSFPLEERRSRANLIESLRKPDCNMYSVRWGNDAVAFIIAWDLKVGDRNVVFVEHMAIHPKMRGRGYGSVVLNKIAGGKDLILEVEPPDYIEGSERMKRIKFYKNRAKLHLNAQFDYVQPPYDEEGRFVPLVLMSRPPIADAAEFERYAKVIYEVVYGYENGQLPLDSLPLFEAG